MKQAMRRISEQSHPGFPVTIYYAFKQSEKKGDTGTASTGWETFLEALIRGWLLNRRDLADAHRRLSNRMTRFRHQRARV